VEIVTEDVAEIIGLNKDVFELFDGLIEVTQATAFSSLVMPI
jgi:hypothetical protein